MVSVLMSSYGRSREVAKHEGSVKATRGDRYVFALQERPFLKSVNNEMMNNKNSMVF